MKRHTFVICAYKESPYLEECILSLRNQAVKSSIIMVTSTPNEYIKKMGEKFQIPCYINNGKGGITQDWNFGYACADSRYVTIAHQDDVYERDYLKTALRALEGSKRPLIYFSDYYEIRNGRKTEKNRLLQIKRLMLVPLRVRGLQGVKWVRRCILSFGTPICCPAVTFAVENLPKVIFRDHFRACEDWEAWEMISRLKGEFLYNTRRLMGHRIHEGSETSAVLEDQLRTQEEYEMFCKFWPKRLAAVLSGLYSKGQKSNRL